MLNLNILLEISPFPGNTFKLIVPLQWEKLFWQIKQDIQENPKWKLYTIIVTLINFKRICHLKFHLEITKKKNGNGENILQLLLVILTLYSAVQTIINYISCYN